MPFDLLPLPVVALAFVACLAALFLLAGVRRSGATGFRAADYRARRLLTPWEARALAEIRLDLPSGYYACPQVRLADLVEIVPREPGRRRAALNRVASKSVDFAIVDAAGHVVLVVELDDRSHARPDRRARDWQVDAVLARCGVPLLRVTPGRRIGVAQHLASARLRAAG